ncbi:MAG: alkaline phosphatase family protein [Candidatus Palauibacterales bacterium]|nr:alkaline phosphatase family protein [Candidatus Palauibacterales bacterium]
MNHTTSRRGSLALRSGLRLLLCGVLAATAARCGSRASGPTGAPPSGPAAGDQIVVLVSFDGFRWDYPDRDVSPNLDDLAARGVRADGLIPSFPTKTFPNHYTLVTGLVPDHHGIVANTMYDPVFDAVFSMADREEVRNERWWAGEPVWVSAEKHGLATAPLFWPGSEADIGGVVPSHWLPFDGSMSDTARVQWVLDLLDLPDAERPSFLTLYFDHTDVAGHDLGPDSDEVLAAIAREDRALGLLVRGLEERGLSERTNVVVVSDHGMIATSRDRVMFVDDYVDLEIARPIDWNPVLALWPAEADVPAVYEALHGAHPHVSVFLRDSIPARLQYGTNRRVPPMLGIADPGWTITNHAYYDPHLERADGGNHGYDNQARGMQGIFIAAGPAFRAGVRVPAIRNVDVYPMLMWALGLPAAPGDGDIERVRDLLGGQD